MKSVKRGRGPSLMGGIGGLIAGAFGMVWIIAAGRMGAPGIFTAFGVLFVLAAIGNAIYSLANAGRKNRFSEFDITDEREESDPLNQYFGDRHVPEEQKDNTDTAFCPYCGAEAETGYRYCRKCGKELPDR